MSSCVAVRMPHTLHSLSSTIGNCAMICFSSSSPRRNACPCVYVGKAVRGFVCVCGGGLTVSPVLQSHTQQKYCILCAPATPSPPPHCLHQKSQWYSRDPVGKKWMEGGGEGAWEGRGEGWMNEEGFHFCLYCQDWVDLKVSLQ